MIYNNICALCAKHGCSIRQLEKGTGIANGTIRKWNRQSPKVSTILPVADYFGVTLDELVRGPNRKGVTEHE